MEVLKLRQSLSKSAARYKSKDSTVVKERQQKIKNLLTDKLMKSIQFKSNFGSRRLEALKESRSRVNTSVQLK